MADIFNTLDIRQSGWQLIREITLNNSAVATFDNIPANYSEIRVETRYYPLPDESNIISSIIIGWGSGEIMQNGYSPKGNSFVDANNNFTLPSNTDGFFTNQNGIGIPALSAPTTDAMRSTSIHIHSVDYSNPNLSTSFCVSGGVSSTSFLGCGGNTNETGITDIIQLRGVDFSVADKNFPDGSTFYLYGR